MKRRLILGDIHGHKEHVQRIYEIEQPDEVICLGDYVDSFRVKPFEQENCFHYLEELREKHNLEHGENTFIMLLGNHDFHYYDQTERYSGWNPETSIRFRSIIDLALMKGVIVRAFIDYKNKTIYSHAGVASSWLEWQDLNDLEDLFKCSLDSFRFAGVSWDGDSPLSSPIWIRPYSLSKNMYKDKTGYVWKQVVGHTQTKGICNLKNEKNVTWLENDLILCDCLPFQYMIENLEDDGTFVNYEVKDLVPYDETVTQ
jgi:hypothetical protein